MARNVTLSQLRTDIAAQCDFSTSVSGRYSPTLLNRIINQSIQRFRERISNEGMTHFLVSYSGSLTQGTTSTYAFQTLDLSALDPSVVRTYGVDITIAGVVKTLAHRPFTERNDFSVGLGESMTGTPIAWAHFQTRSIAIMPAPDGDYPYTVWYLPVLADLSADGDTFDGVAGWEVWVMWDCVCQLIARDQYAAAYAQADVERGSAWTDIVRSATKVSAAGGAVVGRDSMGQLGLWGRGATRSIGSAGTTGLPPTSSVTNAMLADRIGPIVLGRLDLTTGPVADVPVASLIPHILGVPSGLGQKLESGSTAGGFSWQQRRGFITLDVDYSGGTDASAAIQAALNSARTGQCVMAGDGRIRVNHAAKITIPAGVTFCGSPQGLRSGPFQIGGLTQVGTQFEVYGTGDLFELGIESKLSDFAIFYPNQQTNAVPDVYGWSVLMTNIGCEVANITGINPYQFIKNTGGGAIKACWGYPLLTGILLGRVPDSLLVQECRWNPTATEAFQPYATLRAWVAANGRAFQVDGAESFMFAGCFAFGYQAGIEFNDVDGDSFNGTSGSFFGGGFDGTTWPVHVAATHGLSSSGCAFNGSTFTTPLNGVGVLMEDNQVPGSNLDKPHIFLNDCHANAPPASLGRFVWITSTSYGKVVARGGQALNVLNEVFRNDSSNSLIHATAVGSEASALRINGSGPILDQDGWVV